MGVGSRLSSHTSSPRGSLVTLGDPDLAGCAKQQPSPPHRWAWIVSPRLLGHLSVSRFPHWLLHWSFPPSRPLATSQAEGGAALSDMGTMSHWRHCFPCGGKGDFPGEQVPPPHKGLPPEPGKEAGLFLHFLFPAYLRPSKDATWGKDSRQRASRTVSSCWGRKAWALVQFLHLQCGGALPRAELSWPFPVGKGARSPDGPPLGEAHRGRRAPCPACGHHSAVASCKTGGPCWVAGRLGLALPETGAEVLGLLPSPRQALTRERLELTDPTTHGCSSGDLRSEVFLTCPRSTRGSPQVAPFRWAGTWMVLFPPGQGLQHSRPSCPGWASPSFMSGVGGLAGRWSSLAEQHRIGLWEEQPGFPGPGHQCTSVMLTWLTRTQQEPRGPRTASWAEDSWRGSRGVVGGGF